MIELLIFHLHIIGALYAFTKRWQEANVREGILAILIIGLVFTIGWSITGTLARFIVPAAGWAAWFTRDTMSLVLLVIPEIIFFIIFFLKDRPVETSPGQNIFTTGAE